MLVFYFTLIEYYYCIIRDVFLFKIWIKIRGSMLLFHRPYSACALYSLLINGSNPFYSTYAKPSDFSGLRQAAFGTFCTIKYIFLKHTWKKPMKTQDNNRQKAGTKLEDDWWFVEEKIHDFLKGVGGILEYSLWCWGAHLGLSFWRWTGRFLECDREGCAPYLSRATRTRAFYSSQDANAECRS